MHLQHPFTCIVAGPTKVGKTEWTNVVCSCTFCNNRKDNRTPKQAGMKLLKKPTVPVLNKKVDARVMRKLGIEPISDETWKGYWDVTLLAK